MKYVVLLVCMLGVAGCDMFSTRAPEAPDTGNTFIWTPTTSVDFLLTNFIGTTQLIDASNFARAFVKESDSLGGVTYSFQPAPGLDPTTRSIFTGWTVESERGCLSKLKSLLPKSSRLTLLVSNKQIDQSSTTASVSLDYTISIPVEGTTSAVPPVVQGSMQLELRLVSTDQGTREWRILTWSDFQAKNSDKPTWTDLKVRLNS